MGKHKFQPVSSSSTQGKITVTPSTTTSTDQLHPTFSLEFLQSAYCITRCDKDDKANFAEFLRKLSSITWREINTNPRHGLGFEHIQRNAIRAAMPSHLTDDVKLIAFRFSGNKPVVGYRELAMFHVLWLDRDFTLYDHE